MPAIPEFTPELDEEFLRRMGRRIEERGAQDVGRARGEAIGRGLGGDVYEASAVGQAREGTSNRLADLASNLAMERAGMQREERLVGEGRRYQTGEREASQIWQGQQATADRAFRERMARLGYEIEGGQEATRSRRRLQNELWSSLAGTGSYIAGSWLGRAGGGSPGGGSGMPLPLSG